MSGCIDVSDPEDFSRVLPITFPLSISAFPGQDLGFLGDERSDSRKIHCPLGLSGAKR